MRWKRLLALVLACLLLSACTNDPDKGKEGTTVPTATKNPTTIDLASGIAPLCYPAGAVKTVDPELNISGFCQRAAGASSYEGNRHMDGTNLVISPHYTAKVNGQELPVYATPVYVADGEYGTLHSFSSFNVDFSRNQQAVITLKMTDLVPFRSAQVFSQSEAIMLCANGEIVLKVHEHGVYTVVINDSQNFAITVFVRTWEDEEAAIAAYQQQYGQDHVKVYEPGLHEIDYELMMKDNSVLYLKAGAILLPKHTLDITNDTLAASAFEPGAKDCNAIGLNRFPVINGCNADNLVIAGRGTVDMTQLDWHERRGIVFTLCSGITMDGVILINPCEWAFITYRCEDVAVTQSAVLGYRTNSDAFAICNSINVQVSDCFARTGDDMFEVKTLGGVDGAVSKDITFSRCQAWGSKARCFGVIGEIEKDVSNILFEDGIVIFRDAVWDNDRIGSLVVLRECGSGVVDGVTFRNMTVHFDFGRPIQVGNYSENLTDSKMVNILFENITMKALKQGQIRINSGRGNQLQVRLQGVTANREALTAENAYMYLICDREDLIAIQ